MQGTWNGRDAQEPRFESMPHEDLGDLKALTRIRDKRRTTDIMCCLVFVAFCVGMVAIVCRSLKNGDPRRLYHGFDYKGNLCGVSPDVVGMPLMYWPKPQKLKYPICVGHCPDSFSEKVLFPHEQVKNLSTSIHKKVIQITVDEVEISTYPSHPLGGRLCLPLPDHTHNGLFKNFSSDLTAQNTKAPMAIIADRVQDITNGWAVLLFMLPFAVLSGYAYMYLLKHCARMLTWGLVWLSILSFAGIGFYCLVGIGDDDHVAKEFLGKFYDNPSQVVKIIGYASCAITVILIILLACVCQTIQAIVGVIEASCDAIWAMPFLLPMPVLDIGIKILFTILWMVVFCWVITSGKIGSPEAVFDTTELHGLVKTFDYSFLDKVCIGYFCLGLVWTIEIITAFIHFVISYSCAIWYFTPCVSKDYEKPPMPAALFVEALYCGMRYHTGSLALGAFIVALFRLCHAILEIIARQAHAQHNPLAECIAHCLMCCVWCFEEVVRFINKNAIIEIVLKSTNFFTSAGAAVKKLANASATVVGLNGITVLFQALGTITISTTCAFVAFFLTRNLGLYASKDSSYFLEQPMTVVACAFFIGFVVASAFMVVLDMVSDTLLFCWLTDTEDGVTEFAPAALRSIAGHPVRSATAGKDDDF